MKTIGHNYAFIRNFRGIEGTSPDEKLSYRIEYYGPYLSESILMKNFKYIEKQVGEHDVLSYISARTFLAESFMRDMSMLPSELPRDEYILANIDTCEKYYHEAHIMYGYRASFPRSLYSFEYLNVYGFKWMYWIRNAIIDFTDNDNLHVVFHGPYDSPEEAEEHKHLVVHPMHKADTQLILTVPEVYKEFEEKENGYSSFEPWYGHLSEAFCEQAVVRL